MCSHLVHQRLHLFRIRAYDMGDVIGRALLVVRSMRWFHPPKLIADRPGDDARCGWNIEHSSLVESLKECMMGSQLPKRQNTNAFVVFSLTQ